MALCTPRLSLSSVPAPPQRCYNSAISSVNLYCSIDIMIDMHAIGIARRDGIDRALAILVIVLVVILIVACKVG